MTKSIDAIVEYFESGIKQEGETGRLGIELEHILTDEQFNPVPYSDEHGSRWVMEQLRGELPETTYGEGGALIGVAAPGMALSLEPAAQLEISAGPYEYVNEIRQDFEYFEREITNLLEPHGQRLVTLGYHPTARADDLELIPKGRYRHMDAHFQKIGPYGRRMMRGSAATQISIDYYSEQDCMRKLRIASGLAPAFALLCDNSPAFEGSLRPHHMMRTEIWRYCDPARCGLVSGVMEPDFSFEKYAHYVLGAPAIFVVDEAGKSHATEDTFAEIYASKYMDSAAVEHVLSLFFNDARLKTYIEIRPADSMPTPFVAAYAALVKGLFYSPESLDELDNLLDGVDAAAVEDAKSNLMEKGYDGTIYGKSAGDFIDKLFDLAQHGLSAMERSCLPPLAQLAASRKTLAMIGERTVK